MIFAASERRLIRTNILTKNRTFASEHDRWLYDIACLTLERAVRDWNEGLNHGELESYYTLEHSTVFRSELLRFFRSRWFEKLLAIATDYPPDVIRKALGVDKWE